jgi:uncharacterized protein (TIGR02147 family)
MERPVLFKYSDLIRFMEDMIRYRKQTEKGFTVAKACQALRRCSPALISNILAGKRKLTVDRVGEVATVLGLTQRERHYLKEWLLRSDRPAQSDREADDDSRSSGHKRRRVSSFLLRDWINPYVKDAVRLESVQVDRDALYRELGGIASQERINQALKFLLQHGYLRTNQAGKLVESEPLNVLGDEDADEKIRKFHKKTLDIAKAGLDTWPIEERLAQAMLIPLDAAAYGELLELIQEFGEKLRVFSETHADCNQRLYQFILHLTPTGGSRG